MKQESLLLGRRVRLTITCGCGREHELALPDVPGFSARGPGLTARQASALALAAEGLTDREIARRLNVSLGCVKHDIRTSLVALSARNRTHAVVIALRVGAINSNEADPGKHD